MERKIKLIGFVIILVTTIYSCTKDNNDIPLNTEGTLLKHVLSHGKIIETYYYTSSGKIKKHEGTNFCETYEYNNADLLVENKFFVNSNGNFILSEEVEYYYNFAGRLDSCKVSEIDYDIISPIQINSFEYTNDRITKTRIHPINDTVTNSFYTFNYDTIGNMIGEKYFLKLGGNGFILLWEMVYKYDNKNSPFKFFGPTKFNGEFGNNNNVIEAESLTYYEIPEWNQNKLRKFSYEYNKEGFPIK